MITAAKVTERTTLRHFPSDLFIEMSSEISSAMAFPRPLTFCIFWEGMPLDPFSLGRPRRSIHSSCAHISKSYAMPLKVRVFHLAISRRANGTSMLAVRRENSPIQSFD